MITDLRLTFSSTIPIFETWLERFRLKTLPRYWKSCLETEFYLLSRPTFRCAELGVRQYEFELGGNRPKLRPPAYPPASPARQPQTNQAKAAPLGAPDAPPAMAEIQRVLQKIHPPGLADPLADAGGIPAGCAG
jgi:hypothetical protein